MSRWEVDSDDWAVVRMAELRAAGEKASFRVEWRRVGHHRLYEVKIRRADGSLESAAGGRRGETMIGTAWVEEQLLRNAAVNYARAALQPEEQRRRVEKALNVLRLLGEGDPATDRVVFQRDELDDAFELARLTLLHAGRREELVCRRHDCPRDGDCPVHGKHRPGQCVPVGEKTADRGQQTAPEAEKKPRAHARAAELIEAMNGAVDARMAGGTAPDSEARSPKPEAPLEIPAATHICRRCDKVFHRPFRCCGADAELILAGENSDFGEGWAERFDPGGER